LEINFLNGLGKLGEGVRFKYCNVLMVVKLIFFILFYPKGGGISDGVFNEFLKRDKAAGYHPLNRYIILPAGALYLLQGIAGR
jgi:hypothetical protein